MFPVRLPDGELYFCSVYSIIFAILGFVLTRSFLGAIAGFVIGGIVQQFFVKPNSNGQGGQNGGGSRQSFQDIFDYYTQQTQRYDFPTQLLALSAYMMKSDGKVVKSELN